MSKPLADQIVVNFPQRGSRTENVRHCSTATSIADKRQGQWVPVQKPRRKSNNSVIGERFDHTYISFTDSCFQIAAHLLSKKSPTNKPTHNKKNPWVKEVRKVHFHLQRLSKKVPYFSTNIKLEQIDQRMATVIRYLNIAIWKEKFSLMTSTWEKLSWPTKIHSGPIPFSTNPILSCDLNMKFPIEIDVFIFAWYSLQRFKSPGFFISFNTKEISAFHRPIHLWREEAQLWLVRNTNCLCRGVPYIPTFIHTRWTNWSNCMYTGGTAQIIFLWDH